MKVLLYMDGISAEKIKSRIQAVLTKNGIANIQIEFGDADQKKIIESFDKNTGVRPNLLIFKTESDKDHWDVVNAARSPEREIPTIVWSEQSHLKDSCAKNGALFVQFRNSEFNPDFVVNLAMLAIQTHLDDIRHPPSS